MDNFNQDIHVSLPWDKAKDSKVLTKDPFNTLACFFFQADDGYNYIEGAEILCRNKSRVWTLTLCRHSLFHFPPKSGEVLDTNTGQIAIHLFIPET